MSQGPALLPVRYVVIPEYIKEPLPEWATSGVSAYPVENENYHYALRAMRRGYIYIYYPYLTDWEAWSVCDDGSLWKQLSAKNVLEKAEPDCRQGTYSNGGKDFLTLPYEVLENDIWIAFTQCPWTENTLERYASDGVQRQSRMQCVSSSNWRAPQASQQITEATTANLASVLDYIPAQGSMLSPGMRLPYGTHNKIRVSQCVNERYAIVKEPGPQETLYPWKSGVVGNTIRQMKERGVKPDGSPVTPLLMALHDAIGITHELTGWTNDVLAMAKIFGDERALEFCTQNLINGVKEIIKKSAEQNVEEQLAALGGSLSTSRDIDYAYGMYVWNEGRKGNTDVLSREEFERQAKKRQEQNLKRSRVANNLRRYKRKIKQESLDSFINCSEVLTQKIDKQLEVIIAFRCQWLKSPCFIRTLQDFYSDLSQDNLHFREIAAFAMSGLGAAKSGVSLLDDWIKDYSTADENNLVWRTHFYNAPELMTVAESLLARVRKGVSQQVTEQSLLAFFESKSGDLVKLFEGFSKATAALDEPLGNDPVWSKRVLYQVDQHMATLGSRLFSVSGVGPKLDTINDLVVKTLCSLSAGKTIAEIKSFSSKYFGWATERSYYVNEILFVNPQKNRVSGRLKVAQVRFSDLEKATAEFSIKGAKKNAYRATSINFLVLFFNMAELYNQADHFKRDDFSSYAKLVAAGFATTGGAVDIVSKMMDVIKKDDKSFPKLKWVGASCAMLNAIASLGADFSDAYQLKDEKSISKRWAYRVLYLGKILNDVTTIIALSGKVMPALMSKFGWSTAVGSTDMWLGRAVAPTVYALGIEWIGVFSSWQFALLLVVVDYALKEYFFEDEIQVWLQNTLFGKKFSKDIDSYSEEKKAELIVKCGKSLMECVRKIESTSKQN
ncbi:T6SS effector BTH_I2691 family protein [Citrobacter braakii]|uniref:T6SS effector BTH_I2691 family protein n=4 Tax=Citrobacter braakii TaxID=57706 RepID=UPI0011AFC379|nr:T6SS effector BTH_I2691 family protein [Citrobacter braakii]